MSIGTETRDCTGTEKLVSLAILLVWTFVVAGCGISIDFWSITVCRMLVGVGEASFISLAAPFIDDNAPVTHRIAWLGIFYMCIPTGIALSYVYGGWVGDGFGWSYGFFGETILMLSFAILGVVTKPLQMKGFSLAGSKSSLKTLEMNVIEVEVITTDKDVPVLNQGSNKPSSSKPSVSFKPERVNEESQKTDTSPLRSKIGMIHKVHP
ncbi:probable sphingolipid transporter spinster homolog 2 isoform X2 [Tanacetum coccineum]|uniref:Probable sphingolipid transporter spinster homolog 2 isoform X2 n=1 Tax=Tanacetum coccineum TaxID=301880 RepID=A0ABQ5BAC5_9ASTR